ncbi:GNAT family N-acetyltransferase [Streptomyces griseoviridis]|uniref:GNAT family N-acetyltransferase n=1 Tax=Streptomyces griseoviridis TaxID=45398 RepID=UPI0033F37CCE
MEFTVRVHTTIDDVDERWDDLMTAARAPVFYRRPFLRAFERHPLHPVLRTAYLLVEDDTGQVRAALPAYLQRDVDPMRVIADHCPHAVGRTVLLSHAWHCYDSVLPVRPGPLSGAAARRAVRALREVAAEWGARLCGIVNADGDGPLGTLLPDAGFTGVDIDVGWGLPLGEYDGFEDYLGAALKRKARQNLRRDLREADRAGVTARSCEACDADLDTFVRLARTTAAKFGNSDYYRPGLFQDFVKELGDCAQAVELRVGDRTIASALTLTDDTRLHYWAVGYAQKETPGFSPFYVAYAHVMREAWASGREWVELGRRNPSFKSRYALRPRPLRAYFADTGPQGAADGTASARRQAPAGR